MKNKIYKTTLSTAMSVAMMTLGLAASQTASAGMVTYGDPVPAGASYPGCLEDLGGTPTGNDGGISYEWQVKMGKRDEVSFVNHVGAKSFNEPPPDYEPPFTGWTHTSNWVALEITHRTKVKIKVARQEGVPFTNGTSIATARNKLVPALAIYSGWDNTSCEDHRYNTAGNIDWTTVQYIASQPNSRGKKEVEYEIMLDAGQYSIAIGGSPKVPSVYPDAATCNPSTDPVCYAYTGRHGFRVEMKTGY
ncbi:MAG: hypothetical protein IPN42_11785 [Methylococcaceae bacterium]|nr:hypothetical protein [Methylococcaceae bacterium]